MAFVGRPYKADFLPPKNVAEGTIFGPSMAICGAMLTGKDLPDNMAYPNADAPVMLDEKISKDAAIFHQLTTSRVTTDYVKNQW
ncbi:hypothetical protein TSTA_046160 [Talaromyces stipitatus ATCC 10500]|uniref:Uncharacterized protein n=1 Tax=Talaromyces stipitatus (strain ATCC 10500 / CBS 375.48 / QM 6759 / NRRL 1006) TaxID=441959 RepID=B8MJG2_TALSN|nr:uncharacterized protein TSTA_046160 [Talaromyces stipitatus ATCC 10500]EED15162.1 hypothetical protein TSTA_046160 [Talaromyces stipitatus ATCC 10500]